MKNINENKLSRRDALRLFGIAGLGLTVINSFPQNGLTQEMAKSPENLQGAGFYRFKVGTLECAVVSDGVINLKPSEFFVNPVAEVEKLLRDEFLPTDKLTLQINTLVVKSGDRTALFDTGIGSYAGDNSGRLLTNLKRAGIAHTEVTDVFLSHAHFDHISGNFNASGTLNFPKATFHLSETEWTTAIGEKDFFGEVTVDEQTKKLVIDSIRKNLAPLKNRVKLFKNDVEIFPGVSAITAYGHTPGHSTYRIKSGSDSLIYVGDLIHHVIQLSNPQIQMNGNSLIRKSIEGRQRILQLAAAEKASIMAAHFPFPGIGHLRPREAKPNQYEWVPIEWQW